MVTVRRSTLIAVWLLSIAASTADVPLTLSGNDGHLRIANQTAMPVELRTSLIVELAQRGLWTVVPTKVFAIPSCAVPVRPVTTIAAHSVLEIARWSGLSCSAQCELACRANFPLGSGPFRFRVTPVQGPSITGPSFMMRTQSVSRSSQNILPASDRPKTMRNR